MLFYLSQYPRRGKIARNTDRYRADICIAKAAGICARRSTCAIPYVARFLDSIICVRARDPDALIRMTNFRYDLGMIALGL